MKIIDTHCDALLKLWRDTSKSFADDVEIDTNAMRLKAGQVNVQVFAIWVPETTPHEVKFRVVQEQINVFHERVLAVPGMIHIRSLPEIEQLQPDQIGAVLSLEGMDPVGTDLGKLDWLYEQGICSIGLTWNQANLCADGIGEERGAGLTSFGKQVIERNNQAKVLNDVSHLSLRAFWDVIERSTCTIASHSNAYTVCQHERNLRDDQIDALIENNSFIGLVFFPTFIKDESGATIADLLRHFDYVASRGGVRNIGFGSDFDGISRHVTQLEHAGRYDQLINELLKHYREEEVNGFCQTNFIDKVVRHQMFQEGSR
ncbi:membrane dipeptidase [Alkalihalobacillus xiaoxiensis]|uniref:Membrane dipeptidase n=1 Tax=Shouchella xiaoxiensis TaxID=766895 RepID=A0ABS2T1A0_9BACI|nr:dipeptidase [Shouchella xiaoxiensis]MBM7840780.1 membrane dipeptidase [Shouchella xiaoxiensis]